MAWPLECSNVFTFGGLATDLDGRVVSSDGAPIPGLYAAGEVTGLYHGKYTGATSVLRGLVFGRLAGRHAGRLRARPRRNVRAIERLHPRGATNKENGPMPLVDIHVIKGIWSDEQKQEMMTATTDALVQDLGRERAQAHLGAASSRPRTANG